MNDQIVTSCYAACQCDLGREKILTAPPYIRAINAAAEAQSRLQTAPVARDLERSHQCPMSHIFVTFRSPVKPTDTFTKVFPASTSVKALRRKISKLIDVCDDNILLTKNRNVLKDITLISNLNSDTFGNVNIDVFTKDNEKFSLSTIKKDSDVGDVLSEMQPKKAQTSPFITIKFKVKAQGEMFTRLYHRIIKVHEVKKNLGELFQIAPDNLVLLRRNSPLLDHMFLLDLDYDQDGVVELDLLTKNKQYINFDKLGKEMPNSNVMRVTVILGDRFKNINVEVRQEIMKKPFLGGFRNVNTGLIYHHAYTQTPQKPEKLLPENKSCRDTQTAEMREKIYDTCYSRAIQMDCVQAYIPNVTDRVLVPGPYETFDERTARLNHNYYATIIQRSFRHYQFRQKVTRWLQVCMERIARMKEEERLEKEAVERRRRKDLITKTFPRSREDFEQLYAMVDRWKYAEISRISQLHTQGPKIAEFSVLLDKEVELLKCIDSYRVKVKEDYRKTRENQFLEEITKPIAWYGRDGKVVSMDTIEIQRARKLKDLYNSFLRTDMQTNERIELLVDMKFALQGFRHTLAEEIIDLLDRESDLIIRRYNDHQLEFLRRRTAACVLQFIKTSELNSGVTKCKDIREYRKMENSKLYLCEMCNQVKSYTQFPVHTRLNGFFVCTSCSWKDVHERFWVDMTPFKFILRATQRDERKRKCWGSLAFVLQEKDVYFIVEKIWHSHSAISEWDDIKDLRLCRWRVKEDWSPWNCFLVTLQEMKAHIRLEEPESVYDDVLVRKVIAKHKLAKGTFEQLLTVNKRYTESGDWQRVRATATDRVDAVERI